MIEFSTIITALNTALLALALYVLQDLRGRIVRVEDHLIDGWPEVDRRKKGK